MVEAQTNNTLNGEEKEPIKYQKKQLDNELEYTFSSNKETIINNLISYSDFEANGTVYFNGKTISLDDYYDFSSFNKFEIAEWLGELNVFSNDDLFYLYNSLIETRQFNNIECLNPIYERYQELASLQTFGVSRIANPFQPQLRDLPSVQDEHFTIFYDDITIAQANYALSCFETIYVAFDEMGFSHPIPEDGLDKLRITILNSPDPNDQRNAAGIATPHYINGNNSNKMATDITIFNYGNNSTYVHKTMAHEYFHGIQFAYHYSSDWHSEAFANWAQNKKYDMYGWNDLVNSFIESDLSLTHDATKYGAMIFPLTLERDYGGYSTIRKFYEIYENSNDSFSSLINSTLSSLNYSDTFNHVFKKMSGYCCQPSYFYNNVSVSASQWDNTNKIEINLNFNDSVSNSFTLNQLCRKYFTISIPEGFYGKIKVSLYSLLYGSHLVPCCKMGSQYQITSPIVNGTSETYYFNTTNQYFPHSNLEFAIANCSASSFGTVAYFVELIPMSSSYSFTNYTRFFEKQYIIGESDEYRLELSYSRTGPLIIQTMGSLDTYLTLTDSNDNVLVSNDDSGYSYNAFIKYQFIVNTTYRLYVRFYSYSQTGTTKLTIMPSDSYNTSYSTGISSFTDIYNFNIASGNVKYMTNQQYQVRMVKFTPPSTGYYHISTGGDEDTFIYIINPASSNLLVYDVDYTDDEGEDGDGNAGLIISLNAGTPYLIIVSLYSIPDTGSFTLCIYPSSL